ncbi:6330_t:CDS:2, partial [Cetraspora pellucida]
VDHNMSIDEPEENLISTVSETDKEVNLKSLYNSLIPKFKLPSDPLATMYSSNLDLTTNTQNENNDGFTLVSSKRKSKN